ncbi:MAG TPA: transporter [Flavobacteriaceae bacterium]|nr:transporter [Flavobacteriaceae bacterium]
MKKICFVLILVFTANSITAQYTEIINSKRPGFSESPYSIGSDVLQFEGGFFYETNKEGNIYDNSGYGGKLFVRYGKFLEKLEINAEVTYQKDEITEPPLETYNTNGISKLTIGAKYLVREQKYTDKSKEIRSYKRRMAFDKKRLIPSIGVYAGYNTNFVADAYKQEDRSFKAALLLQNDLSNRFVILTNLIADNISLENKFYSHIVTATYAINYKWSFFVENQGFYKKTASPKFNVGGGIAYLWNSNLQLDASYRTLLFNNIEHTYTSVGASWRWDRHSDEIINKNQPDSPLRKKRGNFFSRLFKKN